MANTRKTDSKKYSRSVVLKITPEMFLDLVREAENDDRTLSGWVRVAVRDALNEASKEREGIANGKNE